MLKLVEKSTSVSDWIRTNDPQLRRLLLYPTELRKLITATYLIYFFELTGLSLFSSLSNRESNCR